MPHHADPLPTQVADNEATAAQPILSSSAATSTQHLQTQQDVNIEFQQQQIASQETQLVDQTKQTSPESLPSSGAVQIQAPPLQASSQPPQSQTMYTHHQQQQQAIIPNNYNPAMYLPQQGHYMAQPQLQTNLGEVPAPPQYHHQMDQPSMIHQQQIAMHANVNNNTTESTTSHVTTEASASSALIQGVNSLPLPLQQPITSMEIAPVTSVVVTENAVSQDVPAAPLAVNNVEALSDVNRLRGSLAQEFIVTATETIQASVMDVVKTTTTSPITNDDDAVSPAQASMDTS
jgi:hypothetical protein